MSRFTGRQSKGAMQRLREIKREEAEARNSVNPGALHNATRGHALRRCSCVDPR